MVVGFTIIYAISVYHHLHFEFESSSRGGVLDTTLCDKVCHCLAAGRWFSQGTSVSSTNKTDCHDITEILLKVALNTIKQPTKTKNWNFIKSSLSFVVYSCFCSSKIP